MHSVSGLSSRDVPAADMTSDLTQTIHHGPRRWWSPGRIVRETCSESDMTLAAHEERVVLGTEPRTLGRGGEDRRERAARTRLGQCTRGGMEERRGKREEIALRRRSLPTRDLRSGVADRASKGPVA